MCIRKCRVKSDFPPNARPQNRQTNGRSPVCLRTCNFRFSFDRTHFPQNGQAKRLYREREAWNQKLEYCALFIDFFFQEQNKMNSFLKENELKMDSEKKVMQTIK